GHSSACQPAVGPAHAERKNGAAAVGYPAMSSDPLLIEAAPEPILHPAGERTAGALTATLARGTRRRRTGMAAPGGQPRAGDGKHHTTEHHDETENGKDWETSDHGGLECHT